MAELGIHDLYRGLRSGHLSRRDFIRRATALGISTAAIGHFLRAANVARAQDALAPPVVMQPCEGDGCLWAGKTLTVQSIDDSVKIPWEEVRGEFEAATGATLNLVLDPIDQAFPRLIEDAASGTNTFDAAMIGMWWLGDLVAGEFVRPYDDLIADTSGKFPPVNFEDELPGMRALRMYDDQKYVVPYDADGQVLYYRRDLLDDQANKDAFLAEVGYELAPPQTWEQLRDIAKWFNGKPLGGDAGEGHGISMHLKVGGQGMFHFMSLSAPFVIGPENPKLYWFDPDNMEPLVESPGPPAGDGALPGVGPVRPGSDALAGRLVRPGTTSSTVTPSSPTPGATSPPWRSSATPSSKARWARCRCLAPSPTSTRRQARSTSLTRRTSSATQPAARGRASSWRRQKNRSWPTTTGADRD